LVDLDPADPDDFERRFADAVNSLAADPGRARAMGLAGRERAVESFGWDAVAERTAELYRSLVPSDGVDADATGTPVSGPARTTSQVTAQEQRRAEVFGDVLPETTTDDRDPEAPGEGVGDDWFHSQVPPHHG
jgi:hypothetical protein